MLAVAILLNFGCKENRYQLVRDEQGRLVRLDRTTGTITGMDRGLKDKEVKNRPSEAEDRETLPKQWQAVDFPDQEFSVELKTRYGKNTFIYECIVRPFESLARKLAKNPAWQKAAQEQGNVGFEFSWLDKNERIVQETFFPLSFLKEKRDASGILYQLAGSRELPMDVSVYQSIVSCSIQPSLDWGALFSSAANVQDDMSLVDHKELSAMVLEKIIWNPRTLSYAVINNAVFKENDSIGLYRLKQIKRISIILEKDSKEYELFIEAFQVQ